jgi:hypothetical protein
VVQQVMLQWVLLELVMMAGLLEEVLQLGWLLLAGVGGLSH